MLAAGAFVVGFRAHTSSDNAEPAAAASSLNAARASVLESSPASPGVRVALADVAALPALQGEPKSVIEARAAKAEAEKKAAERAKKRAERLKKERAARRKRAAARHKRAVAAAKRRKAAARKHTTTTVTVTPRTTPRVVATPVPTPVYKPPVYTPPAPKKSYVGKDFDSKG